jgi:hypothetical protein
MESAQYLIISPYNFCLHDKQVNQLSEGCGIIAVLTAIEAYVTSSLALLLPNLFSMTTTTLTSTSSLTCTASTTACAGRRRRAIVEDLLDHLYETLVLLQFQHSLYNN